jgi:hypothetical protein
MGRRQQKSPINNSQTRRVTPNLKQAENDVLESPSHQDPETIDEEHAEGDVAQDEATVAETPPPEVETKDAPTDDSLGGVEPGGNVSEAETDEFTGQATSDEMVAETSSARGSTDRETDSRLEETVASPGEVEQTVNETTTDETTARAATAAVEKAPAGDASTVAQTEVDSAMALALRRLREKPLCCCGCGGSLSGPKKHFLQGHDGKAKTIVRKIMRGEMKAEDAPPELILRHSEIKFIRLHPEFHSVVETWRELCGVTPTNATK